MSDLAASNTNFADLSYNEYSERLKKFYSVTKGVSTYSDQSINRSRYKPGDVPKSIAGRSSQFKQKGPTISDPEYDLMRIAAIVEAEPIVDQVHRRIHSLFVKNKFCFCFEGFRQKPIAKLKLKAFEMQLESGKNFDELVYEIISDWTYYSNAFLIKRRDKGLGKSFFKIQRKKLDKISHYERVHPALVRPVVEDDIIMGWAVYKTIEDFKNSSSFTKTITNAKFSTDKFDFIPAYNMVHLAHSREAGFVFGKPRAQNIEDDVRALRQIEENAHMYLVKHIFPLVHIKIGTEKRPAEYYPDGTSEVEFAFTQMQNMPSEGMIITPERYEVQVLQTNSGIDIISFVESFKARVFLGLGVSPIDMGVPSTSNRSTADRVSTNLKDRVRAEQNLFALQFSSKVLTELMLDQGIKTEDALGVGLFFNEIDLEMQMKKETHLINSFNNNVLTEDELREAVGRQKMTSRMRSRTHFRLHTVPLAVLGQTPQQGSLSPEEQTLLTLETPENQFSGEEDEAQKVLSTIKGLIDDIEDDEIKAVIAKEFIDLFNESEIS